MRKVVVVVHADHKIGFAAATHLVRKGHHVIALGSDPEMLEALRHNVGRIVGLDTIHIFNTHDDVDATIEEINRRTTGLGVNLVVHPRPIRASGLLRALTPLMEPVGGRVVAVGPTPLRRTPRREATLAPPAVPGRSSTDPELESTLEPRLRTFGYRIRGRHRRDAVDVVA